MPGRLGRLTRKSHRRRCKCVIHRKCTTLFSNSTAFNCEAFNGLYVDESSDDEPDGHVCDVNDDDDDDEATSSTTDSSDTSSDGSDHDNDSSDSSLGSRDSDLPIGENEDSDHESTESEVELDFGDHDPANMTDVEKHSKIRKLAREISEKYTQGKMSQADLVDILQIFHGFLSSWFGETAPVVIDFPKSMYLIEKWAAVEDMGGVLLDICQKCKDGYVFKKDSSLTHCPNDKCNHPRSSGIYVCMYTYMSVRLYVYAHVYMYVCMYIDRQMLVGGLVKQVQDIYKSPQIAQV
jgi:hypothetical protein